MSPEGTPQDPGGMRRTYDAWPEMAAGAYRDGPDALDMDGINHVVFAGMGGSGALGDLAAALMSGLDMHVSIVKGYNLPRTADADTLVVCSSVSGNTAETLTVLAKAAAASCRTVSFSSGGQMEAYCRRNSLPHHTVETRHSPRASFVSFLYTMISALDRVTKVPRTDVSESIRAMERTRDAVTAEGPNPARDLAGWLSGMPVVYYPWGFKAAATRFKNSLQENAKTHAMTEDVLEASHNGIVAWESASPARPVLIQGPDDDPKTKERWRVFEEYFEARAIPYRTVRAVDGHILTKLVNLIYLLDYTTIYLAGMRGVDPTPVDSIGFVRERTAYG